MHFTTASSLLPFVVMVTSTKALTTEDLNDYFPASVPLPGKNVDGGSVATNYIKAVNDKQFFIRWTAPFLHEKPGAEMTNFDGNLWCSNFYFATDNNVLVNMTEEDRQPDHIMGYTGHCLFKWSSDPDKYVESGGQLGGQAAQIDAWKEDFVVSMGIGAYYNMQTNQFEGVLYGDADDMLGRFTDDGRSHSPILVWETHDAGDFSEQSFTSAFTAVGKFEWQDAETTFGKNSSGFFTPEAFVDVRAKTWAGYNENEKKDEYEAVEEIVDEEIVDMVETEDLATMNDEAKESDTSAGSTRKLFGF